MKNRMYKFIIPVLSVLVALLLCAVPVLAALYSSTITVTESNGTSYPMLGMIADMNNAGLISGGYIAADGLDTQMKDNGGNDIPYMLTTNKTLWVAPVTGSKTSVFNYEMGVTPNTNFPIITGYNGYITTADAAALEPSNKFEIEIAGYFDTSAAGKYSVNKPSAVSLYTSNASEVTGKIYTGTALSFSCGGAQVYSKIYGVNWALQTFKSLGEYCPSVRLTTQRYANPTGNFIVEIYATSSGVPTGSAMATCTVAASSISTNVTDTTFNFTAPVQLTNGTTYAVVVHCTAGDASNYINWGYVSSFDTYADGQAKTSTNSGGAWSNLNYDFSLAVYTLNSKSVTGTGISSGYHTLKLTADGTNLKLYDGATEKGSTALSGTSVQDVATDWVFLNNNSVPYADYIKITVNGTLILTYQPVTIISGTTLPDTTGTAQDGTFTFGSNPAGITATVGSLKVGGSTYTPSGGTSTLPNVAPGVSGNLSGSPDVASSPFYPMFDAIYEASSHTLSVNLQAIILAAVLAVGLAIAAGTLTQGRSFFMVVMGLGVGAGIGYALKFYQDIWILYVLGVLALASLVLDAKKSW